MRRDCVNSRSFASLFRTGLDPNDVLSSAPVRQPLRTDPQPPTSAVSSPVTPVRQPPVCTDPQPSTSAILLMFTQTVSSSTASPTTAAPSTTKVTTVSSDQATGAPPASPMEQSSQDGMSEKTYDDNVEMSSTWGQKRSVESGEQDWFSPNKTAKPASVLAPPDDAQLIVYNLLGDLSDIVSDSGGEGD